MRKAIDTIDRLLEEGAEQRAEIERLTRENALLCETVRTLLEEKHETSKISVRDVADLKAARTECERLRAEIERLKGTGAAGSLKGGRQ